MWNQGRLFEVRIMRRKRFPECLDEEWYKKRMTMSDYYAIAIRV